MSELREIEMTEIKELVVFGIGCLDYLDCQAQYGDQYAFDQAIFDEVSAGCEIGSDPEWKCDVRGTKSN